MSKILRQQVNKHDHFIGSLHAPIMLVEYGDIECPLTARAMTVTDKLIEEFRDHICFTFRHYPDVEEHPNSVLAAMSAEAAHEQGKFWKMLRHLMKFQHKLSGPFIVSLAEEIGLDREKFFNDLENNEDLLGRIQRDLNSAEENEIEENPPTFFLNGIMLEYPINYDLIRDEILSLLTERQISLSAYTEGPHS